MARPWLCRHRPPAFTGDRGRGFRESPAVDHKKFAELIELLGEFRPVLEVFDGESDRGAILVAASLLDATLRELLALVMVEGTAEKLFGYDGPFGAFSAKIKVAHAIGLIPSVVADHLGKVRRIRNECAHSPHSVDFNTDKVRDLIPEPQRTPGATLIRARFLMNAAFLLLKLRMVIRACRYGARDELWLVDAIHALHRQELEQKHAKRMQEFAEREAELDARAKAIHDDFEKELAVYAETAGVTVDEAREQIKKLDEAEQAAEAAAADVATRSES